MNWYKKAQKNKQPWEMSREEYALKDLQVNYTDDAFEVDGVDAAGSHASGANSIKIKNTKDDFYRNWVLQHEQGHYLYDDVRGAMGSIMTNDPELWDEAKSTSSVRSHSRGGLTPYGIDWVEALADLRAEAWARPERIGPRLKKMLSDEMRGAKEHRSLVEKALSEGKNVSPEILKEYGLK